LRIAIIGDDLEFREELCQVFSDVYEITVSIGDPIALDLLRIDLPNAVILDLDLASFDGFELLSLIGADAKLRRIPLIALSSNGDFDRFERAHRLGASEFVTKPLRPDDLRSQVKTLVEGGRRPRSSGRVKLGAVLVASGLLTQEQLDEALDRQRSTGERLGEVLVESRVCSEQDIVTAVAGQMRIGAVDLDRFSPQANAIGLLSRDFMVRHRLMPLRITDDGSLELAMTNPLDVLVMDEVAMRVKRRVVPVICTQSGFDEAISIHFSSRGRLKESREDTTDAGEMAASAVVDSSAIELVDALLTDATTMGASDVHLEPHEDTLLVRCRIDGVLHEMREFPKDVQAGVLSRLKIMANLDIAERRLPQDGRTTFELSSGETVDLRLASLPSLHGENVTIRILEVAPLPPTLASLGLTGDNLVRFEEALRVPEGGIAIVGPTGSGKSTTLYTTLELMKSVERKVYTVEDPVERKISGIIQIEVKPAIGLTFAKALRSLVRADPDVIMVGEIRDLETAKMAADAAVTGHKVFSTLHTNDASAAVNRLVEMGVPRYLVAAAWTCFVAQRLARRLCGHCRSPQEITADGWRDLGLGDPPDERMTIYHPVGCAKCFGTGYRGRLGLYEVLVVDDELREAISSGATVLDIQRIAREKGVGSLRDDGVRKVLEGSTSYLELLRVTI
jgi:type IV pilus assembly protein PilB